MHCGDIVTIESDRQTPKDTYIVIIYLATVKS